MARRECSAQWAVARQWAAVQAVVLRSAAVQAVEQAVEQQQVEVLVLPLVVEWMAPVQVLVEDLAQVLPLAVVVHSSRATGS